MLQKTGPCGHTDAPHITGECPADSQRARGESPPFIHSRIRTAQEAGGRRIYKKYMAVLDAGKLDRGFVVFCNVKLRRMNRDIAGEFARIVQDIPEVTECYNISGGFDYLLKIHAPDMKYYQEFILNVLGTVESLGSIESMFVMDEVKHVYGIHI